MGLQVPVFLDLSKSFAFLWNLHDLATNRGKIAGVHQLFLINLLIRLAKKLDRDSTGD